MRALGFDHTAVGWAHIDWPALRADSVAEADRVRRIMEPLGLDVDDRFIWFRNKYLDKFANELKCTVTVPDKRMRDDNFEVYKSFVAFCHAVGCPGITISSGIVCKDDGQDEEQAYEISRDEMRRMVDHGGQYDVELRPEPHGESVMGTLPKCQRMLEDVPGLMISLDYSHFMPQGHTEEEVNVLIPHVGHVHARQANRERLQCRMEDDILDFEHILGALKKHGHDGNVALEYVCVNYRGCYDVDVITETLKLKKELEGYIN